MRRFGKPPNPDINYRQRHGVYAIITRGNKILLTEQTLEFVEIQLPGGGIDHGENPLTALHREAYEETGWKIAPIRKLGAYRRFTYMPEYDRHAEKICHIYHCHAVRRYSDPSEPNHRAVWASPDAALTMLESDGDRHFLRLLQKRS